MKTLNLTSLALAALLFASTSCRKSTSSENNNAHKTAQEFINAVGPKTQTATVTLSATSPQSVTLSGGTIITIPVGALTIGGLPVTGPVTVIAMEVLKRSDVLLSGTNTNHFSGAPLASDGFIYVDIKSNGKSVDHNLAIPLQVSIPAKRTGATQLWEGVNAATGAPLDSNKNAQMAWQQPKVAANGANGNGKEIIPSGSFYNFNLGTTGWINCDVFYSYANPKTTVNVSLLNNPGTLSSFRAYTGETFVFFCAKGTNVCAQLYTTTGPNSVKSYDDSMPIGVQGKMMSFSIKDGHYYYAESEVTITAGLSLSLTLAETTEAQMQAALTSLDSY
jgi:hypothetical protein